MFKKPYKVKTNTAIKGSDRRRLRTLIESSFPNLSSEDANALVSNKSEMTQTKAMTHSGTVIMVFSSGSNPVFFQVENRCYPTVYTLWKFPHMLPTVVTNFPVLEKMANGADLMAPGIIVNETTAAEMRELKSDGMCAVRIVGNMAPIAVGVAVMEKDEICSEDVKGKAVVVHHCFKDTLWLSGDQQEPPLFPEQVTKLEEEITDLHISDHELCDEVETNGETRSLDFLKSEVDASKEEMPAFTMDEVLTNSFLTAVKTSGKKIDLPILTSTFYSSHVLKCCPSHLTLDIRKTTYKKLSVFLKKMQKEKVLQIKELSKGVESIVSINIESEHVKSYRIDPVFKCHLNAEKEKVHEEDSSSSVLGNYKFPVVTELFVISAHVKSLFEKYSRRKGESISSKSIRDVVKQYVVENSLTNPQNPREIILDPILTDCVTQRGHNAKTVMNWEEIHDGITKNMPHAYQIQFEGKDPVVKKGKLERIEVAVDTRTGNKKVTLVHNLDVFGIHPDKFAQHVQVAVAASTSLLPTQNGKGIVALIQGNQVRYLQRLFSETYKVPPRYIQGLENVPSRKK